MQLKKHSLLESIINTLSGYIINIFVNYLVFNIILDWGMSIQQNLWVGLIFMVVSIGRSYLFRRLFTHITECK